MCCFDNGEILIDDNLTVQSQSGHTQLRAHPDHTIELIHLRYHREHHG